MKKADILKKELKKDWYVQGFNAYPIFLNPAAYSGLEMKKELGFGYQEYIFNYKNGFGEMWYLADDFARIWKIIKNKLKKNPNYLRQVKARYEDIYKSYEKLFSKLDNCNLADLTDSELLAILKKCSMATRDGVGIGHILDPIGPGIEEEFKLELAKYILDEKERNHVYAALTTPQERSFIAQEEWELLKIAADPRSQREEKLKRHAKKFFWIQNSYAGSKKLTFSYFRKRVEALQKRKSTGNVGHLTKHASLNKYKFNSAIRNMAGIIVFSAIWQDQRKANALKSVGYFSRVIDQVSRRIKVEKSLLEYLGFTEISKLKNLGDIAKLKKELSVRRNGLLVLMKYNNEQNISGNGYKTLLKYREKLSENSQNVSNELHGSIASQGTAIGRAVVCIGIESFGKVRKGDIIVASMTRPEYMPALKKAAAIITDEGGITSHAAIIARELGIPAVIGTKVATKILKDGDLVEVRANHGVVKILKRK